MTRPIAPAIGIANGNLSLQTVRNADPMSIDQMHHGADTAAR
jgi:hypothetical protein